MQPNPETPHGILMASSVYIETTIPISLPDRALTDAAHIAICIVHGVTLITRNAQDYTQIPGLTFDVWN